jgi:hypothetical protein
MLSEHWHYSNTTVTTPLPDPHALQTSLCSAIQTSISMGLYVSLPYGECLVALGRYDAENSRGAFRNYKQFV